MDPAMSVRRPVPSEVRANQPAGRHFFEHAHAREKAHESEECRRVRGRVFRELLDLLWALGQAIRDPKFGHHVERAIQRDDGGGGRAIQQYPATWQQWCTRPSNSTLATACRTPSACGESSWARSEAVTGIFRPTNARGSLRSERVPRQTQPPRLDRAGPFQGTMRTPFRK